MNVDPPINEAEYKETLAKFGGEKAGGICNISAELLKTRSETMIYGLHAVWHSGTILQDWKRGLVVPIGKIKWTLRIATTTAG